MSRNLQGCVLSLAVVLLLTSILNLEARVTSKNGLKTAVYLSPMFSLEPGSVANKYYYNIDFPSGHIALKSFNAETVDEAGNPVPLYETYLHHWVVVNYYGRKGVHNPKYNGNLGFHQSDYIIAGNAGLCEHGLSQFYGLGSETRRTSTYVPDSYGIETGNPAEIPDGYEERWLLNVHAIDTRGAQDRLGCTECRCDLYNVTLDEYDRPIGPDYKGGLRCCYDETRCKVKEGFQGARRNLYLRYTVEWFDWDSSIVPVKVFILDVTDTWKKSDKKNARHDCKIEYNVESCDNSVANGGCTHITRVSLSLPSGGDVIYGVAHQHSAGIGSSLYGEDGRLICSSNPTYGEGKEAGNEAGYIVGMSTCYPQPGSVTISAGETLLLESNYNSSQGHTGVMGLFYLMIAEPSPKSNSLLNAAVKINEKVTISYSALAIILLGTVVAIALVAYLRRNPREEGYETIGKIEIEC